MPYQECLGALDVWFDQAKLTCWRLARITFTTGANSVAMGWCIKDIWHHLFFQLSLAHFKLVAKARIKEENGRNNRTNRTKLIFQRLSGVWLLVAWCLCLGALLVVPVDLAVLALLVFSQNGQNWCKCHVSARYQVESWVETVGWMIPWLFF